LIYNTYNVSQYLLNRLSNENFTLHLHESIQTNSAHIKMDYGAANSIRIADTPGKAKFAHKFNVVIGLRQTHEANGVMYFSPDDLEEMIAQVITNRNNRRNFVGVEKYETNILAYSTTFKNTTGYWLNSKLICERKSEIKPKLF